MNAKTTLVLLVLVLGVGAWVWFGEQQTTTTADWKREQKKLVPGFKSDDAKRVEIARVGSKTETIALVREEEKKEGNVTTTFVGAAPWKMEQPVQDKADDATVRQVLSKLEWVESTDTLEGERAKKAPFGEVEARISVSRPVDKGGDFGIEIGSKLPGDARYARVVGKPEVVYVIAKDLHESLAKELFEFRGKDLVTIAKDDAARLVAKTAPPSEGPAQQPRVLDFVKKDRFWRIGGEGGDYAERKKVEDLVDKVRNLKPTAIETDAPTPDQLKKLGLEPQPAIELLVEDGKPEKERKKERLLLGAKVEPSRDVRWARLDGKPFVYKIDSGELERELKKDAAGFRSDGLVQLAGSDVDVTAFGARWKGGPEVLVKKESGDWKLEKPSSSRMEEEPTKALLRRVLELKVASREGDAAATDLGKLGLADPGLVLTVEEGDLKREVMVGDPVKDKPGTFYAKRGEDARVLTAKLDDLPSKLRSAPLELRSKTIFKASHWDAKKVVVTERDGKPSLEAEKVNYKWTVKGQDDVDEEKLSNKFLACFDDLRASEMVADVASASVAAAGLDKPMKVQETLDVWDKDKKKEETRTLLVGRRDGDRVLVMEEGGPTIAKVDAEFLDLLGRGFKKGRSIFEISKWDAKKVSVKEGAKELLLLEKKDYDWFRGAQKLDSKDFDKAVEAFEKLEATGVEEATDAKKKERGLAPAWRTVMVSIKKAGDAAAEAEPKTLLIGAAAGEKRRWAMAEGTTEMGVVYDDVATKVDAWLREHPAPAEAPPPPAKAPTPPPAKAPAPPAKAPAAAPPAKGPTPPAKAPTAPAGTGAVSTPSPAKGNGK